MRSAISKELQSVMQQFPHLPITSSTSPTLTLTIGVLQAIAFLLICGEPSLFEVINKQSDALRTLQTSLRLNPFSSISSTFPILLMASLASVAFFISRSNALAKSIYYLSISQPSSRRALFFSMIISPMTEAMLPNVFKLIILQITTFFFLAFYDILIKFDMGSCDRYWSV